MRKIVLFKKVAVLLTALFMLTTVFLTPLKAYAASATGTEFPDVEEMLSDVEEAVSEALSDMDSETVEEIFDFLKEKVSDGSLYSEEGITSAIKEGETQFGITIDEQTATQIVEVMEQLEALGFSGEDILDRAQDLYDVYGADFVAHANEAFTKAVEDAVTSAVKGFFENLWEGIQSSVSNFFENLF